VRDLIRDLRREGVTVFLNSHLLSEVESTCDRVAILKRGRVAGLGTIDELTGMQLEVDVRATGMGEAVAAALVAGGAALYALSPRRLSLEELFVRLVEGDTE
jgi:ABC-2 type transport system ATP-binding protein